jgi:hypothetical protein
MHLAVSQVGAVQLKVVGIGVDAGSQVDDGQLHMHLAVSQVGAVQLKVVGTGVDAGSQLLVELTAYHLQSALVPQRAIVSSFGH